MFPVQLLLSVLCTSTFIFGSETFDLSNKVNVAFRKPVMVWPSIDGNSRSTFIRNGVGGCHDVQPQKELHKSVTRIDLYFKFPIMGIYIDGWFPQAKHLHRRIDIIIDFSVCAYPQLTNETGIILCETERQGRVIEIVAYTLLSLCEIKIYTCEDGKHGSDCNLPCSGTFGPSCVYPCQCAYGRECDPVTGRCPHDLCNNSSGDSTGNCFLLRKTKSATFQFLKDHVINTAITKSEALQPVTGKCISLSSSTAFSPVWMDAQLKPNSSVHGIELEYNKLHIKLPYYVEIYIDGRSCFGMTMNNESFSNGETIQHICSRQGLKGNSIRLKYSVHNVSFSKEYTLKICNVSVLYCKEGFYGPYCQLPCNCDIGHCDEITGRCPSAHCTSSFRGTNCARFNLAARLSQPIEHTWRYVGAENILHEFLKFDLRAVYIFNHVAVTFSLFYSPTLVRTLGVYTEIDPIDITTNFTDNLSIPCFEYIGGPPNRPLEFACSGPARYVIFVVLKAENAPTEPLVLDSVSVYTCMEGTYGSKCEGVCNCRNAHESCDPYSGECASGCAEGFGSVGCDELCVPQHNYSDCWKDCHCANNSECGPGSILCGEMGCLSGWMGTACDLQCPAWYHGYNCNQTCLYCLSDNTHLPCHAENGSCTTGCKEGVSKDFCDIEYFQDAPETTDSKRFLAMLTAIAATVIVVIAIISCCSKSIWLMLSNPEKQRKDRAKRGFRRKLSENINNQILQQHQDYHEKFLQKNTLKKANENPENIYPSRLDPRPGLRRTLLNLEKERRATTKPKQIGNVPGGPSALFNNMQQLPNDKVARWILKEDFEELISRRKERILAYEGDLLEIEESIYRISEFQPLTEAELHKMYEDVERLQIP